MIDFNVLKKEYESKTGIELFNEEGDIKDFFRDVNEIKKPICGKWHVNPIPLTAVKKPFCGIATVDITVLAFNGLWEATRDTMNEFATEHNGTSVEITDDEGRTYSVSYNCQTCGIINAVHDVYVGNGEVFEITQQISFIVIESGVSSYDVTLYIDGNQVPILSLVENKIHTTSSIPSNNGVINTISEQEGYGIDFIVPYMRDDCGNLFREIIDRSTGNEAHCVVLDVAGKKSCHIMQFVQATSNIQPPQNVGMNVSMVELEQTIAKYNRMWMKQTVTGEMATVFVGNFNSTYIKSCTIFWGDGTSEHYDVKEQPSAVHIYTDGLDSHTVRVFQAPKYKTWLRCITGDVALFGKTLRFNLSADKVESATFASTSGKHLVLAQGMYKDDSTKLVQLLCYAEVNRIGVRYNATATYIDTLMPDGKYYLTKDTKFICPWSNITYVHPDISLYYDLYDLDETEGSGGLIA